MSTRFALCKVRPIPLARSAAPPSRARPAFGAAWRRWLHDPLRGRVVNTVLSGLAQPATPRGSGRHLVRFLHGPYPPGPGLPRLVRESAPADDRSGHQRNAADAEPFARA